MLTAEPDAEIASTAVTPSGSFNAGIGVGSNASALSAQFRSNAALRRTDAAAGRSSPPNPTTPLRSRMAGSADHPAGYNASSTSVHKTAPDPAPSTSLALASASRSPAEIRITRAGASPASIAST